MVEAQASQCQIHIVEHLIGEIKQYQKAHGAERILVCYKTVILFNFLERTRRRSMGLKKKQKPEAEPSPKFCTSAGLDPEISCGETVANDGVCNHLRITQTISR